MPQEAHGASRFYLRSAFEREVLRAIMLMTLTALTLYKGKRSGNHENKRKHTDEL